MDNFVQFTSLLVNHENYGPYDKIARGEHMVISLKDITKFNWKTHYDSILNLMKDGIDSDYLHSLKITLIFADNQTVDLTIEDYYINLILWYVLIMVDTPIESKHIIFVDEFKQDTIKEFMDRFLIEGNRKKFSNVFLNNIIDDSVQLLHDINTFALYLSNTLCLEDFVYLQRADPEFAACINADMANMPIEDIKSHGMDLAYKSIERIKNAKNILGYEHCLADAFRASQGINAKQYKEVAINIGTKPDGNGGVYPAAITNSFINGGVTKPIDYFIESSTGRTAQIIKQRNVGTSGSFARLLALNSMDSKLHDDPNYDCRSNNFIKIKINSGVALKRLNNKYYRLNPKGMDYVINSRMDTHLIGETIYMRSPITCASAAAGKGVCYKCYGDLAYTIFDVNENFGINIGRIASEELSSKLTQKLLSAKHLLETQIVKLIWVKEFFEFFEIEMNVLKLRSDIEYKDYKILIDPSMIEMENDEDDDLTDDDDDNEIYNEYITAFDIVQTSTGETYRICNDKLEKMFITNGLNSIIHKKQEVDGLISIPMNDLKDLDLFFVRIENNELSKTLNKLTDILNKKPTTKSYANISDLFQDLLDTTIEGGINVSSTHLEVIVSNQVRSTEESLEKPHWWEHNPPYEIITLNEALTNNPSVVVSLSYQKIKQMLYRPSTFKKRGASLMDLFFMERPQVVLRDLDESKPIYEKRMPGDLIDPLILTGDPNKVTASSYKKNEDED